MKQTAKLMLFALILSACAIVSASAQTDEKAKKRAEELLAQARAAIGEESKIKAVKSLSLAGKIVRSPAAVDMKIEVELDFLFPDKYVKREKNHLQFGTANIISALNGETAWLDRSSSNEMIRFEGFSQKDADERKPVLRAEAARWILALLLRTPNWAPLEFPYGGKGDAKNNLQIYHRHIGFAYAGEADADGKRADLIHVQGGDGFQARLFLDKKTHRLVMMSYTGKLVGSKRKQLTTDENGNVSESESGSGSDVAGVKADEVRVRFTDYRPVDGIQMPHRVAFQSGEGIKEEWELTKIQLNAPLTPEIFNKKV